MESGRIKRMILRDEVYTECQRHLRSQELIAYSEFMSALRMSGGIDEPKQEVINTVRKWFHIPDWRHQAEIRRVSADERMELIADTLTGNYTTQEWIEEGYEQNRTDATFSIKPMVTQEEIVEQIFQRRLKEYCVDIDTKIESEENVNSNADVTNEIVNTAKLLYPDEISINDEVEIKIEQENISTSSKHSFVSNLEVDKLTDEIVGNSTEARKTSPDITTLSESFRRKKLSLHELKARLSNTSNPDLERSRLQAEKAKALIETAARFRGTRRRVQKRAPRTQSPDDDRHVRESSASSCFGPSDFLQQFGSVIPTNSPTRPSRGRGLTRVRGRSGAQGTGRGRGRGRGGRLTGGSAVETSVQSPLDAQLPQPQVEPPTAVLNSNVTVKPTARRVRKPASNTDEARKRPATKRRKTHFQPLSVDNNFNQTPVEVLKEGQKSDNVSTQFQNPLKLGPVEQHFLHGNNQYYGLYNQDLRHVPGQAFNHPNSPSKPQPHQPPESPSKIRQKTKHTVIIQDLHEPVTGNPKYPANLPEYNESSSRQSLPLSGVAVSNPHSVIVKTPSSFTTLPRTPPKIVNAGGMVRTHHSANITQNPKVGSFISSPTRNFNEVKQQRFPSLPQSTSTYNSSKISNNLTNHIAHKKRTQNLGAATTYTPQPDYYHSSSDGPNPDTGQLPQQSLPVSSTTPSSSSVIVAGSTTASSLAGRVRPVYEYKPPASAAPTTSSSVALASSVVRTVPSQPTNSTTPVVHQRKAQPHILATSKLHRNSVVPGATPPSTSNSAPPSPTPATISSISTLQNVVTPTSSNPNHALAPPQASNSPVPTTFLSTASTVVGKPSAVPITSTALGMTVPRPPNTNIIFVQKNSTATLPGQVISTSPIQSGGMVKAPGKAVILRRANNSNVMILELQKNQVPTTNAVSQLIHGNKLISPPQPPKPGTITGAPVKKVVQTAAVRMSTAHTAIITSSHPSGTPRSIRTSTSSPTLGTGTQISSQIVPIQHKLAIRPATANAPILPSPPTLTSTRLIQGLQQNAATLESSALPQNPSRTSPDSGVNHESISNLGLILSNSHSPTGTKSENDSDLSLLSNEVLANSPLEAEVNDEDRKSPVVGEYYPSFFPAKTKISVVSSFSDSSFSDDSNVSPNKSVPDRIWPSNVSEMDNEIGGSDDDSDIYPPNTSQSSDNLYGENEDFVEEEEESYDSNSEETDDAETIELIDLAEDDHETPPPIVPPLNSSSTVEKVSIVPVGGETQDDQVTDAEVNKLLTVGSSPSSIDDSGS